MTGADLEQMCIHVLDYVGVSSATEVQAMHVDGQVAITANNAPALRTLFLIAAKDAAALLAGLNDFPADVRRRLTDPRAVAGAMLGSVKHAGDIAKCASAMIIRDRALILLHCDEEPDLHAEQRLLLVLATMLRDGAAVDTIHVWGAKPPCGSCRAVLTAFSYALNIVYDKLIIFSGSPGQDRGAVARLGLAAAFPGAAGEFGRFVATYEQKLATL